MIQYHSVREWHCENLCEKKTREKSFSRCDYLEFSATSSSRGWPLRHQEYHYHLNYHFIECDLQDWHNGFAKVILLQLSCLPHL